MLVNTSCGGTEDTVVDTEKPVINYQGNITVAIASTESEVRVDYPVPTATDNVAVTVTKTSGLTSGAMFPIGTTTNTFQAKDGPVT
ncbi:hypothetical protein FUMI01_22600 [Flavobacterium sp. UMI-01]|nr:hypothetical protein FUMI01_22600 [Flavobacterium sp. UMI-01]